MLPIATCAWHRHLLCTDSQTKSLAVAHSYRKRPWRHSCGPTASDLNYLDTRLDGQIEGTNRPQSLSCALSFPPWNAGHSALCCVGYIPFSGMWVGTSKPRVQFGHCFSLGLRARCGMGRWEGEMPVDGSSPQFLVLPCPTQTPPADTESWELMSHNENSYETHKQYLHSYL